MSKELSLIFDVYKTNLTRAFNLLGDTLANSDMPEQVSQVKEFIEVYEFGLALELLCFLLENVAVPNEPFELIRQVGTLMQANGAKINSKLWKNLRVISDDKVVQ